MAWINRPTSKGKAATAQRRAAAKYYALPAYRRLRADVLARLPCCAVCLCKEPPEYVPAEEVHHLAPIQGGADDRARAALAVDAANVVPLCRGCHHALHRGGYPAGTDLGRLGRLLALLHSGADAATMARAVATALDSRPSKTDT